MADVDPSGEERCEESTSVTTNTDGSNWMDAALDWAILTMHYLSSTAGADPSSAPQLRDGLASLERHVEQHPEPSVPAASLDLEPRDEADGIVMETVGIVQATVENLRLRRQALETAAARAEGPVPMGSEDAAAAATGCTSPDDAEDDAHSGDFSEWLPFPTKRPSQMDLHGWVAGLQSTYGSGIAGQFKRQRLESANDGAESAGSAEEALDLCADQPDMAPDKGAYLVMMRKRQELADELILSETRYVEDLEAVLKNYYDGYDYGSLANVPNSLRGKKNVVFGNLKKIFEFNKSSFAPALATIKKTPLKIGQTVMDLERELGLYSLYFKNMPAQEDLLQENNQFFRSIQIRLNDPYTLQSYLIKPMQRMTKYKQFLESFQNYTPKTDKMEKFHEELAGALWLIRFQLRHGNDLLVLDRLKGFGGNPAEQGLLLRQGEFNVQDKKGKHDRRVFLFEEMLFLAKKQKPAKGSKEAAYLYKEGYKVCDMGIVENIDGSPSKFELYFKKHNSRESIFLTPITTDHQSPADIHREWVADVQKLLWQQFKRVKERMENLRFGVESSMFNNKRASTIYGEGVSPNPSGRMASVTSGGNTSAGGGSAGYAVPTGTAMMRVGSLNKKPAGSHEISSPVLQTAAPGAYAVGPRVIVGEPGKRDTKACDMPPPTVPPPPVPSAETSASSHVSLPPPELPVRSIHAGKPSDYLTPDEPSPPVVVDDDEQGGAGPSRRLVLPPAPPRPPSPTAADYPAADDDKPAPVPPIQLPAEPLSPPRLVSPTRAPPPPPVAAESSHFRQPLPAIPAGEGSDGEQQQEPIYDEVSGDEFDDEFDDDDDDAAAVAGEPHRDPDRQSIATVYEEVDGVRRKRKAQ